MRKAWVYAVQKEEGGAKVWAMREIEITEEQYQKHFTTSAAPVELHTMHLKSDGGHINWHCSCKIVGGSAFTTAGAVEMHRRHKYEECGDE